MSARLSYMAGWLVGQLAFVDESYGTGKVVPGLNVRVRLSDICMYFSTEENVITVNLRGQHLSKVGVEVYAKIEELDKIMQRATMREVNNGEDKEETG